MEIAWTNFLYLWVLFAVVLCAGLLMMGIGRWLENKKVFYAGVLFVLFFVIGTFGMISGTN